MLREGCENGYDVIFNNTPIRASNVCALSESTAFLIDGFSVNNMKSDNFISEPSSARF